MGRKLTFMNGRLPEVERVTSQESFTNFAYVAIAAIHKIAPILCSKCCVTISADNRLMTFIKRHLSEQELSSIDFSVSGVCLRRVPPGEWNWAVDDTSRVFYTQLPSSVNEMREGYYLYFLKIQGDSYILKVDPYGGTYIDDRVHLNASIEQGTSRDKQQEIEVKRLASDVMQCLSVDVERLAF